MAWSPLLIQTFLLLPISASLFVFLVTFGLLLNLVKFSLPFWPENTPAADLIFSAFTSVFSVPYIKASIFSRWP